MLISEVRGHKVIGKQCGVYVFAKTYANETSAHRAAQKIGGAVLKFPNSRPWFVEVSQDAAQAYDNA